jgi:hypothetical protein
MKMTRMRPRKEEAWETAREMTTGKVTRQMVSVLA